MPRTQLGRWSGRTASCGIDIDVGEAGLLQDIDNARRVVRALRAAGVRVALNDFGGADASLALLAKIPLDVLKIDRSVIRGLPEDSHCVALATASIEAAKSFGLDAVAVGVEKPSQLELLKPPLQNPVGNRTNARTHVFPPIGVGIGCGARFGCQGWEGFLHGRPAAARALEVLLAPLR